MSLSSFYGSIIFCCFRIAGTEVNIVVNTFNISVLFHEFRRFSLGAVQSRRLLYRSLFLILTIRDITTLKFIITKARDGHILNKYSW